MAGDIGKDMILVDVTHLTPFVEVVDGVFKSNIEIEPIIE